MNGNPIMFKHSNNHVNLEQQHVYPFEYNFERLKQEPSRIRVEVLRKIIEHSETEKIDYKETVFMLLDYIEELIEKDAENGRS